MERSEIEQVRDELAEKLTPIIKAHGNVVNRELMDAVKAAVLELMPPPPLPEINVDIIDQATGKIKIQARFPGILISMSGDFPK